MRLPLTTLLCAVLALAGCATAPPPIAPEAAARIKRVAAVSVSADQLRRMYVGVTVFGNEYDDKTIANWSLDAEFEAQLGAAAERVFSATNIKVAYPRADFAHVNDPNGPWEAPAFFGPNWTVIEPFVKALCTRESLDALLVVARRKTGDIFGGTNQFVSGAGIYSRRGFSVLHYLAAVSLYDCGSAKAIATREVARVALKDGTRRLGLPVLTLDEELARMPTAQWTPEIEAQMRIRLRDLPKPAWEDALRSMLPAR